MIGRVPMLFYVPDSPHSVGIRRHIESNGGIVIYIVECCCYQIYSEDCSDYGTEYNLDQ